MKVASSQVEKLRALLKELKPEARAQLIAELERGLLRGNEVPGLQVVLQELRDSVRAAPVRVERVGNPMRLFFQQIEPFLIDDAPELAFQGRISRLCIEPIWAWIGRDLLPAEAKTYNDKCSALMLNDQNGELDACVGAFQDLVVKRFGEAVTGVGDDKSNRRLAFQIGTPRGLEDVNQIVAILRHRDIVVSLGAKLPVRVGNLADDQLEAVKATIDAAIAGRPELVTLALVVLMRRLQARWQLIRLATRAAESDKVSRVAATPYAAAVAIVLSEAEREVRRLKEALARGRLSEVIAIIKELHDTARGLRTELDLASDSAWGKQLAAIRSDVADKLRAAMEIAPGQVRRLLRPRAAREIAAGAALSAEDVSEAEALIELIRECRHYAGELALSEITRRVFSEIQQYLETGSASLVETLRNAADAERAFYQSQADAAVRFCAKVFGAEYAATLGKAVELAASAERKTAARA